MSHDKHQNQHLHYEQINLYQELVHSANSIILRWDRQSRIIFMNQYGLDLFGFSKDELIGKEVVGTIVAETDRSGRDLTAMIEDILLHPKKYLLNKNENICRDGSSLWIQWSNKAIVDSDGSFLEMLSVGIDITAQVVAEKKLRQREKLYQALFKGSFDAHLLSRDGIYIDCNQATLTFLGRSRAEVIGHPMGSFSPKKQDDGISTRERVREVIERTARGEIVEIEWVVKETGSGTLRYAEIKAESVETEEGEIIHISLRDVTEKRILQEELRQRQKLEAIGTLAGGIAHDFNNILMAIMGYTELVQMKLGRESSVDSELEQIRTASVRAKDLVSQILTFSRKAEQAKHSIQISLVAREALQLLRSSIPSTIEIKEQIEAEYFILADPTQIHQVIVNLCTNASLAMTDERGILRISLQDMTVNSHRQTVIMDNNLPPGNYVVLEVEDTGCGIAPEIKNKLFDPYFTTREHGQGSGMGLAVVHGIVQSHHGIITVDSGKDQGALFRLYFPAIAQSVGENRHKKNTGSQAALPTQPKGNILLAEDEESIRELISDFLTEKGHSVTTCVDGEQALEELSKTATNWDLLITDQTMPKMTGMQLSAKVQQIRPGLPIILCTGYSQTVDLEISRQLGFHAIIEKPISLYKLLAEIEKAFIS
ncbi:MAG: PAS domain S-box protein [Desulfobulbaceae bacterium]|nr:PAS domain S-box protein [Desulfobulbaceae bacterium]